MTLYVYDKQESGDRFIGDTMRTAQEHSHMPAKDRDSEEVLPQWLQRN